MLLPREDGESPAGNESDPGGDAGSRQHLPAAVEQAGAAAAASGAAETPLRFFQCFFSLRVSQNTGLSTAQPLSPPGRCAAPRVPEAAAGAAQSRISPRRAAALRVLPG